MTRPTPVTVAVVLLWIGVALSLVLALASFVASGNAATIAADLGQHGAKDIDALRTALVMAGVLFLIIAAIDAVFALRIGKGGRTARVVYTVLAVLGILSSVFTAITAHQPSHWATAALPVVILCLLWLPQSSKDFFAGTTENRG